MSEAKITLIGFHNYMEAMGDDLFKYLDLPAGIDADLVKNNILLRGGEFEVIYSDPTFMQPSIQIWSAKWYRTFEKWVKALAIDYAPLENYDRFEEWEDINTGKDQHTGSGTVNTKNNIENVTKDDGTGETEHTVSAYDSSSYQPKDKEENEYENTSEFESNSDSNTTTSDSKTINTDHTGKHKGRMHGNIGVTTSQQMLESEINIARFNLVENITDIFLREYTIPIY